MGEPTLDIRDLKTDIMADGHTIHAVDGVSFAIDRGEVFGLVGESGCGKTMTALSVMGLVPPSVRIAGGSILFEGRDLAKLKGREMEDIRGNRIGMIFQEPMTSLNPVLRVGEQVAETISFHKDLSRKDIRDGSIELLKQVGLDEPEKRFVQYPHQLSGGQRQRVLIAMAISCDPALVIADEPTTALDVATESRILSLLNGLVADRGMSMLFITHNLNIIKKSAQRIGIMYAGRIVEKAPVGRFFSQPLHPYSKGLLDSVFGLAGSERRLKTIPGFVPRPTEMPRGCKFHPRCSFAMSLCREEEPPLFKKEDDRWARCFLYQD